MSNVAHLDRNRAPQQPPAPLPASIEVEQAYLGALILNNDVLHLTAGQLGPEHFTEEVHRRIFQACSALVLDGRIADPKTLRVYLGEHQVADGVTIGQYVARMAAEAPTVIGATEYARLLVHLHGRRDLVAIADDVRAMALDPPAAWSMDNLIDKAEESLAGLRSSAPTQKSTRGEAGAFATDLLDEIDQIMAGEKAPSGISTGIPDLDRDTGGFRPGDLWIVAGRPGMGKSVLGTGLAKGAAKTGAGTLLFSLEVAKRQLTARILADLSYSASKRVPFGDLLRGHIDDQDAWRLRDAAKRLSAMPLVLDCASRLTVAQIASRVRAERLRMAKLGIKLGVVIIDYLKQVQASDRYNGQRHYEVGEISAGLKQIAKDQDVCVVLLCQLNRQVEGRMDKRPDLADLRESGDLEADADVVAFVYRDAYYIERSAEYRRSDPDAVSRAVDAQHDLELIIGKNRAGATRTHHLWVDIACSVVSARDRGGL